MVRLWPALPGRHRHSYRRSTCASPIDCEASWKNSKKTVGDCAISLVSNSFRSTQHITVWQRKVGVPSWLPGICICSFFFVGVCWCSVEDGSSNTTRWCQDWAQQAEKVCKVCLCVEICCTFCGLFGRYFGKGIPSDSSTVVLCNKAYAVSFLFLFLLQRPGRSAWN